MKEQHRFYRIVFTVGLLASCLVAFAWAPPSSTQERFICQGVLPDGGVITTTLCLSLYPHRVHIGCDSTQESDILIDQVDRRGEIGFTTFEPNLEKSTATFSDDGITITVFSDEPSLRPTLTIDFNNDLEYQNGNAQMRIDLGDQRSVFFHSARCKVVSIE